MLYCNMEHLSSVSDYFLLIKKNSFYQIQLLVTIFLLSTHKLSEMSDTVVFYLRFQTRKKKHLNAIRSPIFIVHLTFFSSQVNCGIHFQTYSEMGNSFSILQGHTCRLVDTAYQILQCKSIWNFLFFFFFNILTLPRIHFPINKIFRYY